MTTQLFSPPSSNQEEISMSAHLTTESATDVAPVDAGAPTATTPRSRSGSLVPASADAGQARRLAVPDRSQAGGAALQSEHGVTTIASSVVAKIAALATQEIPGVQAMGKSLSRAMGAIRSKVPGAGTSASTQGVSVEVGESQAAVDIDIVAYYGQSIVETASAIRDNVIERIESMTGLQVVEVNVSVDDLYLESDEDKAAETSRVA
jgi:uncharacterized alkaline shock family protein YloU